jgi:hypothetical protein
MFRSVKKVIPKYFIQKRGVYIGFVTKTMYQSEYKIYYINTKNFNLLNSLFSKLRTENDMGNVKYILKIISDSLLYTYEGESLIELIKGNLIGIFFTDEFPNFLSDDDKKNILENIKINGLLSEEDQKNISEKIGRNGLLIDDYIKIILEKLKINLLLSDDDKNFILEKLNKRELLSEDDKKKILEIISKNLNTYRLLSDDDKDKILKKIKNNGLISEHDKEPKLGNGYINYERIILNYISEIIEITGNLNNQIEQNKKKEDIKDRDDKIKEENEIAYNKMISYRTDGHKGQNKAQALELHKRNMEIKRGEQILREHKKEDVGYRHKGGNRYNKYTLNELKQIALDYKIKITKMVVISNEELHKKLKDKDIIINKNIKLEDFKRILKENNIKITKRVNLTKQELIKKLDF